MDLLPKIVVSVRQEARSAVYRVAINTDFGCAVGFLLGSTEPFESPAIEFSLVGATPATQDNLWQAPQALQLLLPASKQVAEHTGTEVIGLFMASDSCMDENRNQLEGLWVDAVQDMRLPYIVLFSTDGNEPRGLCCYFANRFPHDALPYRSLRGKLSNEPRHNPRRVQSLWHELLRASKQNVLP
jgi:hypothetical protein